MSLNNDGTLAGEATVIAEGIRGDDFELDMDGIA